MMIFPKVVKSLHNFSGLRVRFHGKLAKLVCAYADSEELLGFTSSTVPNPFAVIFNGAKLAFSAAVPVRPRTKFSGRIRASHPKADLSRPALSLLFSRMGKRSG